MLLSAVIVVQPTEGATVSEALGRAMHAWLLERIARHDAALATELHAGSGPRPFTASGVVGLDRPRGGMVTLRPGREAWFRVTGLTRPVSEAIARALPEPGETLELGGGTFRVCRTAVDDAHHPWAGGTTYAELLQRHALGVGSTPRDVNLHFASPTLFRSQGRDLPLPDPGRVFASYLARWNAFAGIALPEAAHSYAEECVAISRFALHSHYVSFERGNKGSCVGFTGRVRFRFRVGDPYWTRVLRLLAAYAFWCGTGYRTTVGLGQTRMEEHGSAG